MEEAREFRDLDRRGKYAATDRVKKWRVILVVAAVAAAFAGAGYLEHYFLAL